MPEAREGMLTVLSGPVEIHAQRLEDRCRLNRLAVSPFERGDAWTIAVRASCRWL